MAHESQARGEAASKSPNPWGEVDWHAKGLPTPEELRARNRARHLLLVRHAAVRPPLPAGLDPMQVADAALALTRREAKVVASGRRSNLGRRRRRHGARRR